MVRKQVRNQGNLKGKGKAMKVRKVYKGLPIGFADSHTMTDIGPIWDLYFVKPSIRTHGTEETIAIGRIGMTEIYGERIYYATPIQWSPFTNTARRFSTRKDAAIYLLGVYESKQEFMEYLRNNPQPANIGMRHMY